VEYLRHLDLLIAAVVALVGLLATLVAIINWQGRKLSKHDAMFALLDLRVDNIHKDREATRVRKLQNPIVPPPLPPRRPTLDAIDWSDDDSKTEEITSQNLKDTARYPRGKPPEGTNE
jgi:hypothetical protein